MLPRSGVVVLVACGGMGLWSAQLETPKALTTGSTMMELVG